MDWTRIRDCLWPAAAERDGQFRHEIARATRAGLRGLGAVEIAAAALALPHPIQTAILMVAGVTTIGAARVSWSMSRGRIAALASAIAAVGALAATGGDSALAGAMVIESALVVAVPVWPLQALVVGVPAAWFARWFAPGHDLILIVLALQSTAIAAALYQRRIAEYRSRQESLRVHEALAGAQLRAQLAENAAAIGKLAAAVTHEINTPLGSLTSSVDTLLVLASKQASATPAQLERFVVLQADLRRAVQAATDRIRTVIARLQRFINLEEAELQQANINELISDVAILFREQQAARGIRIEFALQKDVPALMCRPQLLSAVFSSLLSNAMNAVNGDGHIAISTSRSDNRVEIAIADNGRGMSNEEIENIFDPGFRQSGSRISSGNWSLFNSRQIVFEHGGEISIESTEGKGTTVRVTLPAS